jgi:hypothetical protein
MRQYCAAEKIPQFSVAQSKEKYTCLNNYFILCGRTPYNDRSEKSN